VYNCKSIFGVVKIYLPPPDPLLQILASNMGANKYWVDVVSKGDYLSVEPPAPTRIPSL